LNESVDIAIIGSGAAGLAASIFAGEQAEAQNKPLTIVAFEGAVKPGAKILVSGGGRCNVTNEAVSESDYWGAPPRSIRKVLKAFDEQRTLEWMESLGVPLKREPTGKWFPKSDKARSVLDALLNRQRQTGTQLRCGCRVAGVDRLPDGDFLVRIPPQPNLRAKRIIMATGGLALPKSGSDGAGLRWLQAMGHTIVPTTPALAPLLLKNSNSRRLEPGEYFEEFAGITIDVRLELRSDEGKKLVSLDGPVVFTHFGISGPAAMNMSRHVARYRLENPGSHGRVLLGHPNFENVQEAGQWLIAQAGEHGTRNVSTAVGALFPERISKVLTGDIPGTLAQLSREKRELLAGRLAGFPLYVQGDRGYSFAETTAGGIDLKDVNLATMESRLVPGLYLCGEILDVDGRIGGFNFQWAWASGYLAGRGAVNGLDQKGVS